MASDRDKEARNRRGRLLKTSNYVFVRADTAERGGRAATRLGFGVCSTLACLLTYSPNKKSLRSANTSSTFSGRVANRGRLRVFPPILLT